MSDDMKDAKDAMIREFPAAKDPMTPPTPTEAAILEALKKASDWKKLDEVFPTKDAEWREAYDLISTLEAAYRAAMAERDEALTSATIWKNRADKAERKVRKALAFLKPLTADSPDKLSRLVEELES